MDEASLTAIRCFKENLRDFGDARTNPEKYNLYNGLANLAEAVAALQQRVGQINAQLQQMSFERRGR